MKRSWIGFALLLVLLIASILSTMAMTRIHAPIEADLQKAAEAAMEENWLQAHCFFREAEARWTKWEHVRACLADHNPVEEIDAAFEMLKVYYQAQEAVSFAGGCQDLARKTAAVGEAHEFVLWNLF